MSDKAGAVQLAPETKQAPAINLVEPETLLDRIDRLRQEIAQRAFQLFEIDGGVFGRERDHWFKAESELLHPVHMQITETEEAVQIKAEVPGFTANDLQVSIEGQRLTIVGKKESTEENKKGKTVYREQCSNEILRVVDLPAKIEAANATAMLKDGVLALNIPKAAPAKEEATKVEVKAAGG